MQSDEFAAYGPLRLQQLQLAHASSVLMYVKNDARDTEKYIKELARKLRPEFGHFYHTEDVKECFKMLAKCNNGEEGVKPIDVVILDFDTQSMKLLDMINKRSSDPKTAHLPLISTIVVLPLEEVGGYSAEGGSTQLQPQLGKTQDDKQQGSEGFDPKQLISAAGGCNAMQGHYVSSKQMLYCALDALYRRKLVEGSYREIKIVKSVSSKYPYFPLFSSGGSGAGAGGGGGEARPSATGDEEGLRGEGSGDEESGRETKSSPARRKTLSTSASAAAVSASSSIAGSTKSLHTMTDWTDSSSMLPDFVKEQRKGYREKNGDDVKAPSEPRQRHEMDEILLAQLNKSRSGGGGAAADDDFSRMSADTAPSVAPSLLLPTSTGRGKAPACSRLLDTRRRPTFNTAREGGGGGGLGTLIPTSTSSAREREDFPSDDGPGEEIDLRVFYDKPTPSLQVEHTVGGLDRSVAASSWKVLNAHNHLTGAKSSAAKKLPSLGQHSNSTMSNGGSVSGSASLEPSQSQSQVHHQQQQQHQHQHHSRGPAPKEVDYATKMLKRMARDNAPDVQVHNLLDVELAHGKVTMGDRDLIESGMKLEKEGIEDQAIFLYTRAGLHSKSPHLSKLFLGNIHFRMGKFMAALKFFTEALHSLEEARHTAQFSSDDYFIANFNRGVTNFRVGNDEQGLADLEMAVSICPDHLMAKEVLAVAMRRMGLYKATIECCKQTRVLRQDVKIAAEAAAAAAAAAALAKKKARQFAPSSSSSSASASASASSKNSSKLQRENSKSGVSSLGADSLHSLTAAEEPSHSLKTIYLPLGESSSMDLKARKALAQRQVIESESSGAMPGEALRAFKVMNSFPLDLYGGLFVKPSSLQSALAVPPELRSAADLDVICTTLRLFPFLRPVPDLIVREVARCVEYRAVVEKGVLYAQDTPCEGLCFLLSGTMQARLDVESSVGASSTHVGDVPQYGAVGYTDLLFSNPNSPQVRSLMKMCKDRNDSLARKAAAPGPAEEKEAERSTTTGAAFKSAEVGGDKGTVSGGGFDAAGGGEDELSDDELEEAMLPRALRSGMFTTYFMSTICELLLVSEANFNRYLYPYAAEDLRKRISVLKSSCVFQDWRTEDLIRLARMGRVQTFRTGEVILTQGDLPSFCYFILKGMCKSYKRPNKCEILDKKLTEAKLKAERHDLKYMFHAGLRHTLSKGSAAKLEAFRQHHHLHQHQHPHHHKHLTEAEVDRHNLGAHISRLEHELARAKAQEAKLADEEEANDEEKESVTKKLVEVSTLQWPMLFGEACVQDPDKGFSRGTIIADTTCDILMIHKIQMQTFKVSSSLLDRFTGHSIFYPSDEALVASSERDEAWQTARLAIVSGLWTAPEPIPLQPFRV